MRNIFGFITCMCVFCEAITVAVYFNQGNLLANMIWALPICAIFAVAGLYSLAESELYFMERKLILLKKYKVKGGQK